MRIEDVANKPIKISARTITVLSSDGKTAGMITGIETYQTQPTRDQLKLFSMSKKCGGINWKRMFLISRKWYYLVDDAEIERAIEFECVDGKLPRESLENFETAALKFGAIIIHTQHIDDNRKN